MTTSDTPTKTADRPATDSAPELEHEWSLTIVHHEQPALIGIRVPVLAMISLPIGRGQKSLGPGTLDSTEISRDHALISRDGAQLVIEDRSKNGTSVNGERTKRRSLAEGDVIGIGPLLLLAHKAPAVYERVESEHIIGRSFAHAKVLQDIDRLAAGSATVLVRGETGSGKDLVARAIHEKSRPEKPFEPRNCALLMGTLLESELFGHVRGAFTGADRDRKGLFEWASAGTVFLDEIAESSHDLQAKLLRVIEEKKIARIGENVLRGVDVRLVAASHADLELMVSRKVFREDLFFRLNGATIRVPPLRQRLDDIPALCAHFMRLAAEERRSRLRIDPKLMMTLLRHPWPGNVRELKQVIGLAVANTSDDVVRPSKDIDALLASAIRASSADPVPPSAASADKRQGRVLRPPRKNIEVLLREHQGIHKRVAHVLGVHRFTLQRWLRELGIDIAEYRRPSED